MHYPHRMPAGDVVDWVYKKVNDEGVTEGEVPVADVEGGEEDLRVD